MRINIAVIEPEGWAYGHFLYYPIQLLSRSLQSLGHDVVLGRNNIDPSRTNILVGSHLLNTVADAKAIAELPCPYIVYQTEAVGGGIVNRGEKAHFEQVYLPILRGAAAVWDGFDFQTEELRQLGCRAWQIRHGYEPSLDQVLHKTDKDVDFLFYGSMSPHREQVLVALQQRGYHVAGVTDLPSLFRDDLIARAKVNVCPWHDESLNQLGVARVTYLLNNHALAVVERARGQEWLEDSILHEAPERFVDFCEESLLRDDRQWVTDEFYDRFRSRPMTGIMEELLEQVGDQPEATVR